MSNPGTKISALTTAAYADVTVATDIVPFNNGTTTKSATVADLGQKAVAAVSTEVTSPGDTDSLVARTASDSLLKKLTWANAKTAIWTALGALVATGTDKATPVDADTLPLSDSAAANATKKLSWTNIKATLKTYFDTLYADIGANSDITSLSAITSINTGQLAGFRNKIINGNMAIDQRNSGASQTFTAGAVLAYCVDRWYGYCTGANVTGQRVAGSGTTRYRYQFTGAASVTAIGFAQRIEAANCYQLNGTTATLSVELANSLLTSVTWTAYYANTTDTFGTLASPTRTQIATGTFTVNATVTTYSTQISIPAAATTGIEIVFTVGAQTSGTWTIGTVQLEQGAVATPFEYRLTSTELFLCQYYYKTGSGGGVAYNSSATAAQRCGVSYSPMRATPSGTVTKTGGSATSPVVNIISSTFLFVGFSSTASSEDLTYTYTASAEL